MKKRLSVLVALVMMLTLCLTFLACNNGKGDNTERKLTNGNVVAEGEFDKGVTLSVNNINATDEAYTATINKVSDKSYDVEKVAVFDVSLVNGSAKVQPNGKVKITMPAPFDSESGYVTYHIKDDAVEELTTTFSNGKITFETASFSYFVIAGKIDENAPTYTLVNKNGNPDANGDYVLFGSYPQTEMEDENIKSALDKMAGDLPQNGNNGKWTSYKYPYGKKISDDYSEVTTETDFMWYIDVKYNGETYRGVYFTYYRPNIALNSLQDDSASNIDSQQKKNGYGIGNLYWFKYEPILWQIIRRQDGKAQLLCMTTIDSQPYTTVIQKSEKAITDETDTHYIYYNAMSGVPKNTLATNYEYSAIRSWLNNDFYNKSFNSKQKTLINKTLLDNKTGEVGNDTTDKVFVPSIAEINGISGLDRKASDYAKSQGVSTSYPGVYSFEWYTRDCFYMLRFYNQKDLLSYDKDRYKNVCTVRNGSLAKVPAFSGVMATVNGVVPSLWITL